MAGFKFKFGRRRRRPRGSGALSLRLLLARGGPRWRPLRLLPGQQAGHWQLHECQGQLRAAHRGRPLPSVRGRLSRSSPPRPCQRPRASHEPCQADLTWPGASGVKCAFMPAVLHNSEEYPSSTRLKVAASVVPLSRPAALRLSGKRRGATQSSVTSETNRAMLNARCMFIGCTSR